jgi:leader peptidase (prepilin peptidase) / N-methyltransferase
MDVIGHGLLAVALCALLTATTITDLRRRVVPNTYLGAASLVGLAIVLVTDVGSLGERGVAMAAAAGVLLCPALINPDGMGMGDVKLAGVIGLYLGVAAVTAMVMALAAGGLAGLALLARDGTEARKRAIPFGPFLAFGGLAGLVVGDQAVGWYLGWVS